MLVKVESPGGLVHSYGLAASQLRRIRDAEVPLTIAVDKVAASGGYMMACVANQIVAAPFAVLGSIGVLAQLPNFHRLLQKNNIDFELFTAGEYKRTVTMFGENTDKGREKFLEDIEETHELFKDFVSSNRPALDMARVATGEVWYGSKALEVGLVDALQTSDAFVQQRLPDWDVFEVKFVHKKNWQEKLGLAAEGALEKAFLKIWQRGQGHNTY
jgi:serine protease SohB